MVLVEVVVVPVEVGEGLFLHQPTTLFCKATGTVSPVFKKHLLPGVSYW